MWKCSPAGLYFGKSLLLSSLILRDTAFLFLQLVMRASSSGMFLILVFLVQSILRKMYMELMRRKKAGLGRVAGRRSQGRIDTKGGI